MPWSPQTSLSSSFCSPGSSSLGSWSSHAPQLSLLVLSLLRWLMPSAQHSAWHTAGAQSVLALCHAHALGREACPSHPSGPPLSIPKDRHLATLDVSCSCDLTFWSWPAGHMALNPACLCCICPPEPPRARRRGSRPVGNPLRLCVYSGTGRHSEHSWGGRREDRREPRAPRVSSCGRGELRGAREEMCISFCSTEINQSSGSHLPEMIHRLPMILIIALCGGQSRARITERSSSLLGVPSCWGREPRNRP